MSQVDRNQVVLDLAAVTLYLGDAESECNGKPLGI